MIRRYAPWVVSWVGWAMLILTGDIQGMDGTTWGVVFAFTLAVSIVAGVTRQRAAMNMLVATVIVVGIARSWAYAQLEAWGPQGVWTVVVGAHLLAYAMTPVQQITRFDCQNASWCPNRREFPDRRQRIVPVTSERRRAAHDRRVHPPPPRPGDRRWA